jgi:arsenate reductase
MAEGIGRSLFEDRAMVQSAGQIAWRVHPEAAAALAEIGLDISGQSSKTVDSIDLSSVDIVITLCADQVCPVVPGAHLEHLHWPLEDPVFADDVPGRFRETRDDLMRRLTAFGESRALLASPARA